MMINSLFYERNKRYEVDFLVFVQSKIWNPFFKKKAHLRDFSLGGFRLEYVDALPLKKMDGAFIFIPLKIFFPEEKRTLKLKSQVQWKNPLNKQIGGTYALPCYPKEELLLKKIISFLAKDSETGEN